MIVIRPRHCIKYLYSCLSICLYGSYIIEHLDISNIFHVNFMKNLWWLFDLLMFVRINNCSCQLSLKYMHINVIYHGLNIWLVNKVKAWETSELRKGLETQTQSHKCGKTQGNDYWHYKWIPLLEFKFCKCFESLKQKGKKKNLVQIVFFIYSWKFFWSLNIENELAFPFSI